MVTTAVQHSDEWSAVHDKTVGKVVAGDAFAWYKSRNYRGDGTVPGFIYCAPYQQGAWALQSAGFARELARRGYPVICGDLGDISTKLGANDGPGVWGNPATLTKLATYKTYLQTNLGAKAGPIGLLYASQGAIAAYGYAYANPTQVFCLAGTIGAFDVEDIRANNRSGLQASIETAWTNNATWQAARTTHNPVEVASSLTIPQLDYYSTNDTICVPSTHAAMLSAAGAYMTQRSLGAIGHVMSTTLSTRSGSNVADFCDWVEALI